jgi:hypothetical protein
MHKLALYLLACVAAAVAPLIAPAPAALSFRGWPSQLDGRPLTQLADTPEELRFYAEHPTRHARFSDGQRIILMRWTDARIDGFHLAGPCFRAFGFQVHELPAGATESCFRALRGGVTQRVCEHIRDGKGRTFASMEAWRLAQALRTTEPPYLGVSIVELE